MASDPETTWQKIDILLKPLGGLLTAMSVAGVGFFGSKYLETRQSAETNMRLYAQLMSGREAADTSLRKEMLETIINRFLKQDLSDPNQSVLALELLAYNFHDALDLAPLFKDVNRRLRGVSNDDHRSRLRRIAQEVTRKQIAALEDAGAAVPGGVWFPDEGAMPFRRPADDARVVVPRQSLDFSSLESRGPDTLRSFQLEVLKINTVDEQVQVRLQVWPGEAVDVGSEFDGTFWVGHFDFPMIDNTRLDNGDRCAVVMTNFERNGADLTLVYFPGSRASLKDRPYYEEVLDELRQAEAAMRFRPGPEER